MRYRILKFSSKDIYTRWKDDPLRSRPSKIYGRTFSNSTELFRFCEGESNHTGAFFAAIPQGDPLLVQVNSQVTKEAQAYREDQIS